MYLYFSPGWDFIITVFIKFQQLWSTVQSNTQPVCLSLIVCNLKHVLIYSRHVCFFQSVPLGSLWNIQIIYPLLPLCSVFQLCQWRWWKGHRWAQLEPCSCATYNIPGKAPISYSPTASLTPQSHHCPCIHARAPQVCHPKENIDGVYRRLHTCAVLVNSQLVWMHLISLALQLFVFCERGALCLRWWASPQVIKHLRSGRTWECSSVFIKKRIPDRVSMHVFILLKSASPSLVSICSFYASVCAWWCEKCTSELWLRMCQLY